MCKFILKIKLPDKTISNSQLILKVFVIMTADPSFYKMKRKSNYLTSIKRGHLLTQHYQLITLPAVNG